VSNAIIEISNRPRFGTGTGLARSEYLVGRLGLTPKSTIGVTGSNGKGSTAGMASALLSAAGLRTGLFTSPHFLDPVERFRINGAPIDAVKLNSLALEVLEGVESIERELNQEFSRFEILTAIAWLLFEREGVEAIVMEAGIGGRFCPTRLGSPEITSITSLDLEHTDILGSSLELIFADKLDLGRRGTECFAALPDKPDLLNFAGLQAESRGISLVTLDRLWPSLEYVSGTPPKMVAIDRYGHSMSISLPLLGPWQANNAALAISCAYAALIKLGRAPVERQFQSWVAGGFASVEVPGRFSKVLDAPSVFVDSAHTPDAIDKVVDFIKSLTQNEGVVLCGMSASKLYKEMAETLAKLRYPFFVSASAHGGAAPHIIAALLLQHGAVVEALDTNLQSMLEMAMELASRRHCSLYVLGGLFFAADVCRLLKGGQPSEAIYL